MLVVSKLVWPVLKNTYLLHNNNHARGFYRSKNSPILLKASTLANRRALTAFPLNSIYIFGRFWVLFSSASLTNVFAILCIEVLASLIRRSPEIEGFLVTWLNLCDIVDTAIILMPTNKKVFTPRKYVWNSTYSLAPWKSAYC